MGGGGMSKARLGRMREVMAGHVERGDVPGLVTLVSRRGETHVDAIGAKAVGGGDPMRRDTIFRITSMTKPVTAAAAMILVEECRLRLDEPVDRLLPELAGRRVLKRIDGPLDDTVPAQRPITLRDLLTFRLGFGLIMAPPDSTPIQLAESAQQLATLGMPTPPSPHAPDEWLRRFATLPLMHQPGERWMYNTGSHVLGMLIARAAGQPLEKFMRERIFEPLGMKDTAFSVPAAKVDRLASAYDFDPEAGALALFDGVEGGQWSRPPEFPDGGAGLVSTVDDYLWRTAVQKRTSDSENYVTPSEAKRPLKTTINRAGTIVDATIIAAPSSTKNATKTRDPAMKQTRKGKQWYFGMKLHIGTDRKGRVHHVTATAASGADITQLPALLHGDEAVLYGDQAYWKEADRQAYEARGVRYRVNRRARSRHHPLSERWRKINRARSRTRARGEHPFYVVKQLWGFAKVRYRGLAKNLARAHTMFALANLYAVRRQLVPAGAVPSL